MTGYNTSKDYKKLKELLDKGFTIIYLWRHDTTSRLFADIARKFVAKDGMVIYDFSGWTNIPRRSKMTFEEYCSNIGLGGLEFIIPDENDNRQ